MAENQPSSLCMLRVKWVMFARSQGSHAGARAAGLKPASEDALESKVQEVRDGRRRLVRLRPRAPAPCAATCSSTTSESKGRGNLIERVLAVVHELNQAQASISSGDRFLSP